MAVISKIDYFVRQDTDKLRLGIRSGSVSQSRTSIHPKSGPPADSLTWRDLHSSGSDRPDLEVQRYNSELRSPSKHFSSRF